MFDIGEFVLQSGQFCILLGSLELLGRIQPIFKTAQLVVGCLLGLLLRRNLGILGGIPFRSVTVTGRQKDDRSGEKQVSWRHGVGKVAIFDDR